MDRHREDTEHREAYLLSCMDEAVVALDLQGRVIYWNEGAERLYQVMCDDAIGQSFDRIGLEDWLHTPDVEETLAQEGRWRGAQFVRLPDGDVRSVDLSITPLSDSTDPVGWLAVGRESIEENHAVPNRDQLLDEERHERVIAEHALQEAETALHRRDESLSIATHELRNLFTTLLGHTQLLQRRLVEGHIVGERDLLSVRVIAAQAQQINQQITSELHASRLQEDQVQLTRTAMDLSALARRVVGDFRSTNPTRAFVWQGRSEPLMVDGDVIRLEQVVHNLLQNAQKYSLPGSVITVRVGRRDSHGCVAVVDHGIGIPAAAQSNLFELFYRAENVDAADADGTGIGLYIAHQIVTLHGGTIEVESTEGVGSTFTVLLPLIACEGGAVETQ